MFCAIAENYEFFKNRINIFIALAPAVYIQHCTSGIIRSLSKSDHLEKFVQQFGIQEILPSQSNSTVTAFFHNLMPEVSNQGIKLIADDDPNTVNQASMAGFIAHMPCGSSYKAIKHFKQIMHTGVFEHYDYGRAKNIERYQQEIPPPVPMYNIVDFPVAIFAG